MNEIFSKKEKTLNKSIKISSKNILAKKFMKSKVLQCAHVLSQLLLKHLSLLFRLKTTI